MNEKGTYPEVEALSFRPDDLTVHKPNYPFHLIWIFKLLESSQVGQEGIDHIFLSEPLSSQLTLPCPVTSCLGHSPFTRRMNSHAQKQ
jgi:hypothetical protein